MTERTPQSVPHREIREPLGILHDYAMLATGVVVSRRNEALAAENEIIERYARLEEQLEACQDYAAEVERERDEWKQRAEVASVEDAHDRAERLQEQLQTTQNILVEERRWREEARVGELHAGDHARELQEQFDAAVAALEHIGSPNYAARPTGRDALDMAEAARTALRRIRQEEP